MMKKMIKKLCNLSLVAALFGCQQGPFTLDTYNKALMHKESGLYVHREIELRTNAARFHTPPANAASGAVSELDASEFTPLSVSSFYFAPQENDGDTDTLLWHGVQHISKYAADGETSIGVAVSWDKEGAVTVKDTLEVFRLPVPDAGQLDTWSPWLEATGRRGGVFSWHAEVNRDAAETVNIPAYPFQLRFRLVLSKRVYP